MQLNKLYSRTSTGKIQEWTVEIEGNKYRTISGQKDGKLVTSQYTECFAKNIGKANATTNEEQAIVEAKALWKKKKDKGYHESIEDIDKELFFEPMLAKKYEDYKDDLKFPLFVQPKLDGIRCIAKKDGLWTRNGKPIVSVPHIFEAVKPYFDKNPNLILDGELYCDKYNNDFNAICSLAKKTKPNQEDLQSSAESIQYWIYDLPSCKNTFTFRNKELLSLIQESKYLKLVKTFAANSLEIIQSHFEKFIEDGYEGLMVRLDADYENKRSSNLLKMKEFQDEEFLILDVLEGEGNKVGGASSILLQTSNGIQFNANVKGNRKYCAKLLKDKKEVIGKMGTVQYFNLTPDSIPRFPYLIAVRDYE